MDKSHIEVYFDRTQNRVGLKPTNSSITGFRISQKYKEGKRTSGSFLKYIPTGRYLAYQEDDMIVFNVKEIAEKIENEKQ